MTGRNFRILCLLATFSTAISQSLDTSNFTYTLDVNSNIRIFWNYTSTDITFQVHANTTGYFGIGFASTPNGIGDILLGYIADGYAFIRDSYINDDTSFPSTDAQQNVELLSGSLCNGQTVLRFRRPLFPCDKRDFSITESTLYIRWMLGPTVFEPAYNMTLPNPRVKPSKGYLPAILIGSTDIISQIDPTERLIRFTAANVRFSFPVEYQIEGREYCNCQLRRLPILPTKHHVVKFEPLIESGNEDNVVQIIVRLCSILALQDSFLLGANRECYSPDLPLDFRDCNAVMAVYGRGAGNFNFPEETGYPLGGAGQSDFYIIEVLYKYSANFTSDSSGIRFLYTRNLRRFDAGIMSVGHSISPYAMAVPPNATSFKIYGDCSINCLEAGLKDGNQDEINVFGGLLQTGATGRRVNVKHVRSSIELPLILDDQNYDPNFQQARYVTMDHVIQQGDSVQVVCDYNTENQQNLTMGGLGASRAACFVYLMYYPAIPLHQCTSQQGVNNFIRSVGGISRFSISGQSSIYGSLDQIQLQTSPPMSLLMQFNSIKWETARINELSESGRIAQRQQICRLSQISQAEIFPTVPGIHIGTPYVEPVQTCSNQFLDSTTSIPAYICPQNNLPSSGGFGGGGNNGGGGGASSCQSNSFSVYMITALWIFYFKYD